MRTVLLAVHVVGFFCAKRTEAPGDFKYVVGIVDMDMDLRLALGAREYQRVAEFR